MARVIVAEVKLVLPSETELSNAQILQCIDGANLLVDALALTDCGEDLSDALLVKVELYLSAHLCAVTEQTLAIQSEKDPCCGGSAVYSFVAGEGILGTPFGVTANMFSSGCLVEYDKRQVGFETIGTIGDC